MKKDMLKHLLFIVALIFGLQLHAQQSNKLVWYTDFEKAKTVALKENKPMFMFFTGSDWCGWCKKLQKEVLTQKEFATWALKNVVLLELDFPRMNAQSRAIQEQNYHLQNTLKVQGYPTIYFVKPTKDATIKNVKEFGIMGYVAGGPTPFIQEANKLLSKK